MAINAFIIDGESSADFGLLASCLETYSSSERSVTSVSVPGRSGDVHIDNGRFNNIEVPYEIIYGPGMTGQIDGLNDWLTSLMTGYHKIEDTIHTDWYRMGRVSEAVDWEVRLHRMGRATVTFDCAPQKWLKSGDVPLDCTSGRSIFNPTRKEAKPLIRVTGTGTIMVGNRVITVTEAGTSYIDIDCDMHNAYEGSANRNSNITVTGDQWPVLRASGTTGITNTGFTSVIVYPRWYIV